ncbi:hypothetical protein [Paenibacillus antarcticus]|nr:hypothetical protein [Paenibacillus antarcticus]
MSDLKFDGAFFAESLVIVILVALFIFGSSEIETLSATPTRD